MIQINQDAQRAHPHQDAQLHILQHALAAVDPAALIGQRLEVNDHMLAMDDLRVSLLDRKIWIIAIGKASIPMAETVQSLLGADRVADAVAVIGKGTGTITNTLRVIEAGHPLPEGTVGADAVAHLSQRVGPGDLVLCLLSGGGSAMLASPPDGISSSELSHMTQLLLQSGATIDEVNTVRRHVSRLQGGQLMGLLSPASVITLVLSDVLGDRLESIASGPTVPDPTSFADAWDVIRRVGLLDRIPLSIRAHLLSGVKGAIADTLKPGNQAFDTAQTVLLGNNQTAVDALALAARSRGFVVHRCPRPLVGEARAVGIDLAKQARRLAASASTRWALIAGGETTVAVRGDGRGGRNQELALSAAIELEGIEGVSLASLATDGIDGITQAAGALVDGQTVALAQEQGMDPQDALARNDSHDLLDATADLLWTGPTHTNVADVVLVLGEPRA
ncbi:DUF4147 domain-containing protein [Candidatus Bipolaricaulota bacterium]|nr:DUF4147 domain-containing protein [Candidatus Bipolaricaulota bacterium]TFH09969.1 MAG: DUF4147 domain-containing protein [Candidatus Atribacteria bacterium]